MTPFILLAIILGFTEGAIRGTRCNDFQANFNLKDVSGAWHVVGIIPEKLFHEKVFICHKVDITEIDEAGLRWLINKTIESPKLMFPNNETGIIIRQRYYSEPAFDVWSKSVKEINGCFQQVISLDYDINKALASDAMMQLHLLEVKGAEPLLVQLLWGKMINVVIYRRKQGATLDELKPVSEFISNLRGAQRPAQLCSRLIKGILVD